MEVGEVVQFYDSDRRFPAWGFGAKTFSGSVSHCFNLNGSLTDSEVTISSAITICRIHLMHCVLLDSITLCSTSYIDYLYHGSGGETGENCLCCYLII